MIHRKVNVKVLPGEPLDGSGKVCIHLFVRDTNGLFTEPHVLSVADVEGGKQIVAGPMRGRLACDPRRMVALVQSRDGTVTVTHRTDDPRAATCPKCKASKDYTELMMLLGEKV